MPPSFAEMRRPVVQMSETRPFTRAQTNLSPPASNVEKLRGGEFYQRTFEMFETLNVLLHEFNPENFDDTVYQDLINYDFVRRSAVDVKSLQNIDWEYYTLKYPFLFQDLRMRSMPQLSHKKSGPGYSLCRRLAFAKVMMVVNYLRANDLFVQYNNVVLKYPSTHLMQYDWNTNTSVS